MVRTKYLLNIALCLLAIWTSSCDEGTTYTQEIPTNVEIKEFKLAANDTIKGLDSVRFVIDQIGGEIFNPDSVRYGLTLPRKYKLSINSVTSSSITIYANHNKDTIRYKGTEDTIDFSSPIRILVKGIDTLVTKEYRAWLNVRTVDPDTLAWQKVKDDIFGRSYNAQKAFILNDNIHLFVNSGLFNYLYTTSIEDGITWSETAIETLPPTADIRSMVLFNNKLLVPTFQSEIYQSEDGITWSKTGNTEPIAFLYGAIKGDGTEPNLLVALMRKDDFTMEFTTSTNGVEWTRSGISPPSDFPVSGSSSINHVTQKIERLSVVGGYTSTGQLTNGVFQFFMHRGKLNASTNLVAQNKAFSPREGTALIVYNNNWWLIGGHTDQYAYSKEIFTTPDVGFTWSVVSGKVTLPKEFQSRANMSCVVDKHNYIWIIGGENRRQLKDVWRGRINKLAK